MVGRVPSFLSPLNSILLGFISLLRTQMCDRADGKVYRLCERGGEDFTADFTADLTERGVQLKA